ncbi:exonuclease SbcCD subunit D [Chloroflexota bacterium]
MKILHTADIHLKDYGDASWKALQQLTDIGKREDIGLMLISGDLFDEGIDAENLRPKIRETFSKNGFPIVILPGNHDIQAFTPGQYFGEDTHIINDVSQPFEMEDVRICGLPFEEIEGNALLSKIRSLEPILTPDKVNILLYHGELLNTFFSYSRSDLGDEGAGRYMPAKLEYFDGLNIQYVLAGHFHTRFDVLSLSNDGYFVYPGSPVAITRRECGRRKVNLFKLGSKPQDYPLDTPHYHEINLFLDPSDNIGPLERLGENIKDIHPQAMVILSIFGYINGEAISLTEMDLKKEMDTLLKEKQVDSFDYEVRDIRQILEDDLFKTFMAKLQETDNSPEIKLEMRDFLIRAMVKLKV